MFAAFVQGAALSGLVGMVLKPRLADALDAALCKMSRSLGQGKRSWQEQGGVVRQCGTSLVFSKMKVNRASIELRTRRLKRCKTWRRAPGRIRRWRQR
eukprot:2925473-Pyramimonas_sp.AAC.1